MHQLAIIMVSCHTV